MPKELRFGELVRVAGKPEVVSLWTDPKRDRAFMKAVKENRVLTLVQEPASRRKDFGQIGFHQEPHASYLIFPKPLPKENRRVIGIKYDLVQHPTVADPVRHSAVAASVPKSAPKRQERKKRFNVVIRRVGVIETNVEIDSASTPTEARRKAVQLARAEPFDPAKAVMRQEVLSVQEASPKRSRGGKKSSG